jgi:outer membrane protein assembly factor BamB
MKTIIASILLGIVCSPLLAQQPTEQELGNWHRWRGPLANGTAPQANPPLKWSETENIAWKVEVPGKGSGSPIVWGDSVFVVTAVPTKQEVEEAAQADDRPSSPRGRRGFGRREQPTTVHQFIVLCFDRTTGKEKWRQIAAEQVPNESGHSTNTFASASPVTNGEQLFVSFGSVGIFCYDMQGKLLWKRDLGDMQTRNAFGEASSPALHGDTLVVPWDHEGPSQIFALDTKTGRTRWATEHEEPTTWNTPLITEHAGVTQVIVNGITRSRSYDLATGKLLWECGGQTTNPIASPVRYKDLAICMTGYRGYAVVAIPLASRGDVTDSDKLAWQRTDAGPYIASPLLIDDQLYYTKSRDAVLLCVDAGTGETVIDASRIPELSTLYASPVAAAGRIYYTDREGTTTVLAHGNELKVLATNRLEEGVDATPAIVGSQLFIRSEQHLYCIGK